MDRRTLFAAVIKKLQKLALETGQLGENQFDEALEGNNGKFDYFASPLTCYSLLSEAPYEFLLKAAREKGIPTENKSKFELAKAIFDKGEGR